MPNHKFFEWNRNLLRRVYKRHVAKHLVLTLAMMITGVLLGPHMQLFAIAMCVPCPAKLPSIMRRFERFVADKQVDVQVFFEPFVRVMQAGLGNETAYLLMDYTQAGPKCLTPFFSHQGEGCAF